MDRCVKCHGPEKQKGGLRLDLKADAFKGGDSGERGIVAGNADASRLFRMVTSGKDERMPPLKGGGEPLSEEQVHRIKQWIDSGAGWPDDADTASRPSRTGMQVTEDDRRHWAFRPLDIPGSPKTKDRNWVRTPVDPFVLRALEAKHLSPSPPADARTLVRRLHFDLTGLPPTPGEMVDWSSRIEASPDAAALLVDSLLASPHYGERWARHWLDVARYADSNGMEGDHDRPNAYHFRDFVIRALNDDMPFDQFIRWQLAGDEIAPDDRTAIAATGFLVAGPNEILNVPMEEEKLRSRANELDDMVSTTAQAMMGLTLACARCHDHKYDPLPTRDYYRMMRVFNGGDRTEVPLVTQAELNTHRAAMSAWKSENDTATQERDEWLQAARAPLADAVRAAKIARLPVSEEEKTLLRDRPKDPAAKPLAERFKKELKIVDADTIAALPDDGRRTWDKLDGRVRSIAAQRPASLPTAFAFADFSAEPRESWFFERGDFMARRERMELGFISVLTTDRTPDDYWRSARESKLRDDSTQQRRAMAEWMTDREHGAGNLVARVMVNRVWQHHFGEGLVRTVNDFGTRGEPPTHPELLEWLTGEFIRSGWSVKHLHRLIVNSATYRQGASQDAARLEADPDNRLLSRRRPQRLEAEALRDSMLATAGTLNATVYGPGFKPPIPAEALQARNVKDPYPKDARDTAETRRRTIYLFHKRVVQYPLLQAFDAPDAQVSCGRRMNTTVAPQALALLDDPFVRLRAGELAARLEGNAGGGAEAQVRLGFALCLGRAPAPGELTDAVAFIAAQKASRQQRDGSRSDPEAARLALTDFCQSLFGLNEFIYID